MDEGDWLTGENLCRSTSEKKYQYGVCVIFGALRLVIVHINGQVESLTADIIHAGRNGSTKSLAKMRGRQLRAEHG